MENSEFHSLQNSVLLFSTEKLTSHLGRELCLLFVVIFPCCLLSHLTAHPPLHVSPPPQGSHFHIIQSLYPPKPPLLLLSWTLICFYTDVHTPCKNQTVKSTYERECGMFVLGFTNQGNISPTSNNPFYSICSS